CGICEQAPGQTATDLYLFVMDHLHTLRQHYGQHDAVPADAVEDLAERYRRAEPTLGQRVRTWLGQDDSQNGNISSEDDVDPSAGENRSEGGSSEPDRSSKSGSDPTSGQIRKG
ncbi:MAG: hypothetical protein MI919_12760, partial [Holophagales bacterium]|nr:hypothetical protein [Holophagales bacterium]